jgi:hypothetical protein
MQHCLLRKVEDFRDVEREERTALDDGLDLLILVSNALMASVGWRDAP